MYETWEEKVALIFYFLFLRTNWKLSLIKDNKDTLEKNRVQASRNRAYQNKEKRQQLRPQQRQALDCSFSSSHVFNPNRNSWKPDLFLSRLFCKLCKFMGYFVAIPTNMSDSCLLETRKNLQATTHNVANHTSHFLSLNSLNCLQRVPLKNGLF